MKRLLFILAVIMAAVSGMQAAPVNESAARNIADAFFSANLSRFSAPGSQPVTRLAYTADADRFYVYDRGERGGFVVVAGDDRLPQVLGYSDSGTFAADNLPLPMQDWMAEMNREIAYLQAHGGMAIHQPRRQVTVVQPLLTSQWDQDWPYNLLCPTYNLGGETMRAVTGCVATAMTQIMYYHKWPLQGTGSHSYNCNVNDTDPTVLSADFSQSFYQWDQMLDTYDQNSSEESCYAVAKLMSDAGISVNMGYGGSSGAQETAVVTALTRYFGYSDRHYLLTRDLYGADEWDQMLIDELSAGRPVLYCGYAYSQGSLGGHAFVFDGVDARGYFHVNWGWGGNADGYFMVSLLAPSAGNNFKFGQDAIFGVVPNYDADVVPGVLYVRGLMHPDMYSAPRGQRVNLKFSDIYAEGNLLEEAGVEQMGYWSMVYDTIPMELRVIDHNGELRQTHRFSYKVFHGGWGPMQPDIEFIPDASLDEGEYTIKVAYAEHKDGNYASWVYDEYGNKAFCRMILSDDMVYLSDSFLSAKYSLESMNLEQSVFVNEPFTVDVTLSNASRHGYPGGQPEISTTGQIRLLLKKNGEEVVSGDPVAISIPRDSTVTYRLQAMAPAQWGRYELMVVDECGRKFEPESDWLDQNSATSGIMNVVIIPKSDALIEDFETMTANNKTNDTNVEGRFTSWNFNKSGVRAPGEGKCHGTNSVMMKKPSTFYSVVPVNHRIFLAEATFFNNSSTAAKFTLEYSVDGAVTWAKALTIDDTDAADVPGSSTVRAMWQLNLSSAQPALFRVAMTGGGSAAAYVDDFVLWYNDLSIVGDINVDGEVNVADVNVVVDMILSNATDANADVNGDGEINIGDVNTLIDLILGV